MSIKITVFGNITRHAVASIGTNVSKEPAASIFRVDGGSMLLRNVGTCLPKYVASYHIRPKY
jgi:hypothetical protein